MPLSSRPRLYYVIMYSRQLGQVTDFATSWFQLGFATFTAGTLRYTDTLAQTRKIKCGSGHVVMRTNEPDTVSSGGLRSGVNKNGRKCQSRRSRPWDCSTCTKERGLDQRRPQVKRKMPRVCTASQKFVGAGQEWCGL